MQAEQVLALLQSAQNWMLQLTQTLLMTWNKSSQVAQMLVALQVKQLLTLHNKQVPRVDKEYPVWHIVQILLSRQALGMQLISTH
jgi:hypothetical protein